MKHRLFGMESQKSTLKLNQLSGVFYLPIMIIQVKNYYFQKIFSLVAFSITTVMQIEKNMKMNMHGILVQKAPVDPRV